MVYNESRAREERGNCCANEERPCKTVEDQEAAEDVASVNVAGFILVFVSHGLQDEACENQHPNPIGAAKTRTVKEGKRGKESAAKGYERRKGKFPFTTRGIYNQGALFLCPPQAKD